MKESTNPTLVFKEIVEEMIDFLGYSFFILLLVAIFLLGGLSIFGKLIAISFIVLYFFIGAWTVILGRIYADSLNGKLNLLQRAKLGELKDPKDILNAAQYVYRYINLINSLRFFVRTICKTETWERYMVMSKKITEKTLATLKIIARELLASIEQNKGEITHAKSKLDDTSLESGKNNAIISMSKMRLDHQIQQFEELQKVLVKI